MTDDMFWFWVGVSVFVVACIVGMVLMYRPEWREHEQRQRRAKETDDE